MGRLFWKVFAFTLLAQLIATLGIGGAIWLKHAAEDKQPPQIDRSPPANLMIESAAATLQFGGIPALHSLLESMDTRHPLYAIGDDNRELLGRDVLPSVVASARASVQANPLHEAIREVKASDGRNYLLLVPMVAHGEAGLEGMGPVLPEHGGAPMEHGPAQFERGSHPHEPPPDARFLPFLPIISAILGSLIFTVLLAWYFSKPIRHLRSAFAAVADGDLEIDLGARMKLRHDELADLGRDFDAMVERLRTLLDGQRRLLHDVSHELRSPLTRLQFAIGLARQQPERLEFSLERIERESMRMDKLVGELLTLSKLEAGALKPVIEDISINDLLADIIQDAKFEAEASDRKLEYSTQGELLIVGDAELLHRALENVVRNALKQTFQGGAVSLEAEADAQRTNVRISVHDRGPGVPDNELELIFKPFYRYEESTQRVDGHGLGLAIAQRVVIAHGGSIRAFNREGGGLSVEILLPLASTST